jgi:hypothetical protein
MQINYNYDGLLNCGCTMSAFHMTGIDFAMEISVELKILTDFSVLGVLSET